MLASSRLARDSVATRQTQHQRLTGLASTSLPKYVLVLVTHMYTEAASMRVKQVRQRFILYLVHFGLQVQVGLNILIDHVRA